MFWIVLAAFVVPLIYTLASGRDTKRAQTRELERIQRRLAAKESNAQPDNADS